MITKPTRLSLYTKKGFREHGYPDPTARGIETHVKKVFSFGKQTVIPAYCIPVFDGFIFSLKNILPHLRDGFYRSPIS